MYFFLCLFFCKFDSIILFFNRDTYINKLPQKDYVVPLGSMTERQQLPRVPQLT